MLKNIVGNSEFFWVCEHQRKIRLCFNKSIKVELSVLDWKANNKWWHFFLTKHSNWSLLVNWMGFNTRAVVSMVSLYIKNNIVIIVDWWFLLVYETLLIFFCLFKSWKATEDESHMSFGACICSHETFVLHSFVGIFHLAKM